MLLSMILLNFVLTLSAKSENVTEKQVVQSVDPSKTSVKVHTMTLLTEGGSVVATSPVASLPNENSSVLLSLEQEFTSKKQKPVKARKGVDKLSSPSEEVPPDEMAIAKKDQETRVSSTQGLNSSTTVATKYNLTTTINTTAKLEPKEVKVEHVKKPTILSYDELSKDEENVGAKITLSKASVDPVVADQMPSPNHTPGKIAHLAATSRNPNMVTPIVITILVVPVFAVLGYMALKHGKEAWKNRHYKRMDFLLDGMYND